MFPVHRIGRFQTKKNNINLDVSNSLIDEPRNETLITHRQLERAAIVKRVHLVRSGRTHRARQILLNRSGLRINRMTLHRWDFSEKYTRICHEYDRSTTCPKTVESLHNPHSCKSDVNFAHVKPPPRKM